MWPSLCNMNSVIPMFCICWSLPEFPLWLRIGERIFPFSSAGGPATYNAEPVADFFDVFSIGEGEESLPEFARLYINMKKKGNFSKKEFLHEAAKLEGFYVPSLYEYAYKEDGTVKSITPVYEDIPKRITKRIIKDLDKVYFPTHPVIPVY